MALHPPCDPACGSEQSLLAESHERTSVCHLSHRSTDMYSQIYGYIVKMFSKKNMARDVHWSNEPREPHTLMRWAADSRRRPIQGALELPETWKNRGPTRPQAHLSQSAYISRFRHPWCPSELVPAIRLEHSVSLGTPYSDVFWNSRYISYLAPRSMR